MALASSNGSVVPGERQHTGTRMQIGGPGHADRRGSNERIRIEEIGEVDRAVARRRADVEADRHTVERQRRLVERHAEEAERPTPSSSPVTTMFVIESSSEPLVSI